MSVNGFDFDGTVHRYNYNSLDNIPPNIAPAYSASSTYAVGDYCTKDNVLYKCSTAIPTAEAWNSAHWTQVQLATDVADLKDDLSSVSREVAIEFDSRTNYYIDLSGQTADLQNPVYNQYAAYRFAIVPCSAGDNFIINATGGGAPRAWGFVNSQNGIISKADSSAVLVNQELTAPNGAVYLVINDLSGGTSYKIVPGEIVKVDLLIDEIPDTVQTYTFSNGSVSQVVHTRNNAVIRTDAFIYASNSITEVRTLNTGESLTIVTNLTTLETTITYSATA